MEDKYWQGYQDGEDEEFVGWLKNDWDNEEFLYLLLEDICMHLKSLINIEIQCDEFGLEIIPENQKPIKIQSFSNLKEAIKVLKTLYVFIYEVGKEIDTFTKGVS